MGRIGVYSLTASNTSADQTIFDYSALPGAINGKMICWQHVVPAVSAATCCAEIAMHDADNNLIWNTARGGTSGSTTAEATTTLSGAGLAGQTFNIPLVAGDHFHIVWSARPSGDDDLPAGAYGANVTSTLRIWVEEK